MEVVDFRNVTCTAYSVLCYCCRGYPTPGSVFNEFLMLSTLLGQGALVLKIGFKQSSDDW